MSRTTAVGEFRAASQAALLGGLDLCTPSASRFRVSNVVPIAISLDKSSMFAVSMLIHFVPFNVVEGVIDHHVLDLLTSAKPCPSRHGRTAT